MAVSVKQLNLNTELNTPRKSAEVSKHIQDFQAIGINYLTIQKRKKIYLIFWTI